MLLVVAALIAALGGPLEAQGVKSTAAARPARAPDTDETVTVSRGTRLSLDNFAGEINIRAWDRDAVRVQARHTSRTRIAVRPNAAGVLVISSSGQGAPGAIDYDVSVPAWMDVKVEGTYAYIGVEGTQSSVAAETVRGDIVIKGRAATVSAKSVEGEVVLEGVRGRVTASSVNQGVTISGASGDLAVETVNGHVALTNIESANVEVGSVNGNIRYDGSASPNGKVRLSTHNGNISVAVPESASAAFTVRTYNGSVNATLPLKGGGDVRRGRRVVYTLGNGDADFELETFNGTIQLRKRGESNPPSKPRDKQEFE
jgi:hypothetical protein